MTISEERFKTKTTYLLPFEKMHGLGNDFVLINATHLKLSKDLVYERDLAKSICDRHRGIGADGMIIIEQVQNSTQALRSWRFYNSDGSISEACGNGIRCAAKYIYEHGLSGEETKFAIETLAGDIGVEILAGNLVKVNMGAPRSIAKNQTLNVNDFTFAYTDVSMGNPHAVGFFDDLELVKNFGSQIEVHKNFPNKTNVEFAKILSSTLIDLVVWERGCGFTQACGTGACATVVAAISQGLLKQDTEITVRLPGGELVISWDSIMDTIFMTGPAEMSFIGYYNE
jgi:diaminopimelate epimerase